MRRIILFLLRYHLRRHLLRLRSRHLVRSTIVSGTTLISHTSIVSILIVFSLLEVTASELLNKHLSDLNSLRVVEELIVDLSRLGSLENLEISLIYGLFLLNLSHFLKLVVVDIELLASESIHVELLSSNSSAIWGFIKYEGIECFTFLWENVDAFDFSESLEDFSKLRFSGVWREVLHIEVASLL